jgi:hypothetical protein
VGVHSIKVVWRYLTETINEVEPRFACNTQGPRTVVQSVSPIMRIATQGSRRVYRFSKTSSERVARNNGNVRALGTH